jgi:DNA-binding transcriptional regulator YhcF (GntR family)
MRTKRKENLAERIRQEIVSRIASGHYAAGRKIPSVRALMEEFSVSSQTVQRALRLLQEARVVTAIHGSGVFVNASSVLEPLRLAMIFPEESISREHLDLENWGLSSELYRGLLAGGVQYDCRLEFRHVSEEADAGAWRNLAAELQGYDGVVFVGQQLSGLQQLLSHCLPVFQITNPPAPMEGVIPVTYDHDMALRSLLRKAAAEGCCTADCITWLDERFPVQDRFFLHRAERMLHLCAECGLRPLRQATLTITPETLSKLPEMLLSMQADFLFCNHAYLVRNVFELYRSNRQSVLLGAIGSGFTFQGLHPGMIYMRVPMFETGQGIARCVRRLANGELKDKACKDLQNFQAELVIPDKMPRSLPWQARVAFVS